MTLAELVSNQAIYLTSHKGAWIEIYLLVDWKVTNQNRTSLKGARIEITKHKAKWLSK